MCQGSLGLKPDSPNGCDGKRWIAILTNGAESVGFSRLMNVNITLESTLQILNEIVPETDARSIDPQRIFWQVALFYALSVGDLMAKNRTKKMALARQVAMYLLIYELELSPTQVGRMLGGRDHSTIIPLSHAGDPCDHINNDGHLFPRLARNARIGGLGSGCQARSKIALCTSSNKKEKPLRAV